MTKLSYVLMLILVFVSGSSFAQLSCSEVLQSNLSENQSKVIKGLNELNYVLIGQSDVKRFAVMGLITGGHILFEGPTGTGKTDLAKNIGKIFGLMTSRTTFNPEVVPSQLVGYQRRDIKTGEAINVPGEMVGAEVYHADELNRASPRTTNALLEGMEEGQITQDGKVIKLAENFLVIATQNPGDQAGTYQLSEANLDRFMFKITSGYLSGAQLLELAKAVGNNEERKTAATVMDGGDLTAIKAEVANVKISDVLLKQMVGALDALVGQQISFEGSDFNDINEMFVHRGLISWVKAAKAEAYLSGRTYVTSSDLKRVAGFTLGHRIKLTGAGLNSKKADEKIKEFIMTALEQSGIL